MQNRYVGCIYFGGNPHNNIPIESNSWPNLIKELTELVDETVSSLYIEDTTIKNRPNKRFFTSASFKVYLSKKPRNFKQEIEY